MGEPPEATRIEPFRRSFLVMMKALAAQKPTDEVLIRRFLAGRMEAFETLFIRYRSEAYRVAYRLLGNENDALDAVQDGFVKALTNLSRFREESSFKTWLMRVVSHAAIDLGRKRKRHTVREVKGADPEWERAMAPIVPPERELERADLRRLLDEALGELSDDQRRTFILHADDGLAYREVAEQLGISIGTVMSRIFYARQRLRERLVDRVTV